MPKPVIVVHGADNRGRGRSRRRACRFCADKRFKVTYKDPQVLRYFITDRGKIIPRRISNNCAKHQRKICQAIKRARNIAIIPFTVTGK